MTTVDEANSATAADTHAADEAATGTTTATTAAAAVDTATTSHDKVRGGEEKGDGAQNDKHALQFARGDTAIALAKQHHGERGQHQELARDLGQRNARGTQATKSVHLWRRRGVASVVGE